MPSSGAAVVEDGVGVMRGDALSGVGVAESGEGVNGGVAVPEGDAVAV